MRQFSVISAARAAAPLTPEQRQQAAQLAVQSVKDMGLLLSSSSDDATQPIDTAPVFADPTLFGPLSLLHQGQVLAELQLKYDKKWSKMTLADKRLGYYIAYGNWGVRDQFANWNTLEPPYDLPFAVPAVLQPVEPKPTTPIHKIEPVILAETAVRLAQFDIKRMDAVTKFFIYVTAVVVVAALWRDKFVGEEGVPVEIIVEDPYEVDRLRREAEAELARVQQQQADARAAAGKWYYLWLK